MRKLLILLTLILGASTILESAQSRLRFVIPTVGGGDAEDCSHCQMETSFTIPEGWTASIYEQKRGSSNHFHCRGDNTVPDFNDVQWNGTTFVGVRQGGDSDGHAYDSLANPPFCDSVIPEANNPDGRGGMGHRHYRLPGFDNQGGGGITFQHSEDTTTAPAITWHRFYVRYSLGYRYETLGNPNYEKTLYMLLAQDNPGGELLIMGFGSGSTGKFCSQTPSADVCSTTDWSTLSTGGTGISDGEWDCLEFMLNGTTGETTIWVNGTQEVNGITDEFIGERTFSALSSNQKQIHDSSQPTYTDYDDYAVSYTQRIGCFS